MAKVIADKCFSNMDDVRLLRFFAFTINNILVRLYHQGIHIKESEWMEVSLALWVILPLYAMSMLT